MKGYSINKLSSQTGKPSLQLRLKTSKSTVRVGRVGLVPRALLMRLAGKGDARVVPSSFPLPPSLTRLSVRLPAVEQFVTLTTGDRTVLSMKSTQHYAAAASSQCFKMLTPCIRELPSAVASNGTWEFDSAIARLSPFPGQQSLLLAGRAGLVETRAIMVTAGKQFVDDVADEYD